MSDFTFVCDTTREYKARVRRVAASECSGNLQISSFKFATNKDVTGNGFSGFI